MFKATLFSMLALLLAVLFCGCSRKVIMSGVGSRLLKKEDAKNFKLEKSLIQPINTIEINTRIADIEIIQADDYYIEIDYLYWDSEPEYLLEGGKLTFDDDKSIPNSYSINFNPHNIVKLYLPKDASLDRVSLHNANGDVNISGFTAKNLKAHLSYGDLTMTNCAAVEATIKLSSGNSTITGFHVGELNYSNSYGDLKLTDVNIGESRLPAEFSFDRIDISMSSGDAKIDELYVKHLVINNSYGDIDCRGINSAKFNAKLSSGNLTVDKSDIKKLDLSNSYGDISLALAGSEKDYSMDLKTSYGKITVNSKKYDDKLTVDNDGDRSISASLSSGDLRVSFLGD